MPKGQSVETHLDRLAALRSDPGGPHVREELAKALASKTNLIVDKAATLVSDFKRTDLAAELAAAFDRFLGTAADRMCRVSISLARALLEQDDRGDVDAVRAAFLRGVRHGRSGRFGGLLEERDRMADPASELRGLCALGLVQTGYRDVLVELADLLSDPDPPARAGAARALGYTGQDAAALLLRYKLARRDRSVEVTGECLSAVMRLGPRWAVEFVGRFLENDDAGVRAGAALALGESRKLEALGPLRRRIGPETDDEARRPLMLAVAMLRTPEAREALLGVIRSGRVADAVAAVEGLGIYRRDAEVKAQVLAAAKERAEAAVGQAIGKTFGS
jgi:HEAT repeat protein